MKTFISYSHRDEALLERLHAHLAMLRRDGGISEWHDREIQAGGAIDKEIAAQLDTCDLFLALVSPDFMNSGYCYNKEMARALERQNVGELLIVPIILEPCDWESSPLADFKALPKDGKAISEWRNQNKALSEVVAELRRLVTTKDDVASKPAAALPARASQQQIGQPKYRIKKSFDDIDRADYRRNAYRVIREFFESRVMEIDQVPGIRARVEDINQQAFTCMIVNQHMKEGGGQAAITIRASGGGSAHSAMGDIYYSFKANAPENVSNGGFMIEADNYELFMSWNSFTSSEGERKWAPEEAAGRLWGDLLESAGVRSQ